MPKYEGAMCFSIAPVIYHFVIFYMSFANLKNFGFFRLHQHSRHLQSSTIKDFDAQYKRQDIQYVFNVSAI
jgi:hypothetical protein